MWFCPGKGRRGEADGFCWQSARAGTMCFVFGFRGKGGEGSRGGRWWSSYILFRLPPHRHHLLPSFSSSCCFDLSFLLTVMKGCCCCVRVGPLLLPIHYALFVICDFVLSFQSSVLFNLFLFYTLILELNLLITQFVN